MLDLESTASYGVVNFNMDLNFVRVRGRKIGHVGYDIQELCAAAAVPAFCLSIRMEKHNAKEWKENFLYKIFRKTGRARKDGIT